MRLRLDEIPSPIGAIRLIHDDDGRVRALDFEGFEDRNARLLRRQYGAFELCMGKAPRGVADAITAYFDGELDALDRIEVATAGTKFQEAAWAALRTIPVGATRSYAQQASAIGAPKAVRAIGRANGDNPVAIINPCHRVIGANGDLTGFGGGLHRKRWLLEHEGAL